jgi:hypothetical protein
MSRRSRTSSIARAAPALGAVLLLGVLTWPLLFTYSGFSGDWDHHLWLMWHQSRAIQSGDFPSLFLNSSYSVFYPTYAFYGGTVYAVGGLLSLILGGAPVSAYVLVFVLDFAAAFGGWYWLGRMAGLSRWSAMVPGLIFVTSAYYIVIVYVQGDWPELTGISMIPLMAAAGLSVLRADRLKMGAALALAASSILFFGAHNITIMLGLTTLALLGLAIVICVPDARRQITRKGVLRVGGIMAPAGLVSAWYLLPMLTYQSQTRIGSNYRDAAEGIEGTVSLVSLAHLFTFSRTSRPGLPAPYYLDLALPVLAIAWVLVGILILPSGRRNRMWLRVLLICSGMSILVAVVMTHVGLLLALPRPYPLVEFVYRLEVYVLLALSGAVLAALALARGGSRRARVWTWMAIPVCLVSLVGAIQQISDYPDPGQDRYVTLEYSGQVETGNNIDYQDTSAPVVPGRGLPTIEIPVEAVHNNQASFTTRLAPGTLVATNIGAGAYLLHLTGAKAVGVDSETGDMVLQIGSTRSATTSASGEAQASNAPLTGETISVSAAKSLPIVLGRILTVFGLIAIALQLLGIPARGLRHSRSR